MKHALCAAVTAVSACAAPSAAPAPRDSPDRRAKAFVQTVDSLRREAGIPGLSLAVVRDGQVLLARGLGHADPERGVPATADTPYDIASVTKPISAVVALRLVEQGRLDLDAPMTRYHDWAEFCAEYAAARTLFSRDLRCDEPLTLRHLLSMTANGQAGRRCTSRCRTAGSR